MSESPLLALILKSYIDAARDLTHAEPFPPPPHPTGSLGAVDAGAADAEAVATLLSYCEPLEESAVHHACSITRGLVEPLLTFSLFTDCRAVLECCATGLWLLDSNAAPLERIRRSLLLRIQNVTEQEKLANIDGNVKGVNLARNQVAKIVGRARAFGLPTEEGDRPRISGPSPSRTELARDVLDEEATYRILSGAAHGQPSYLRELGMRPVDSDPLVTTVALSRPALELVTIMPVVWIFRLSRELRAYKGLPTVEFEMLFAQTRERIDKATP